MLEDTRESILGLLDELVELGRADEGGLVDLRAVSRSARDLSRLLELLERLGETYDRRKGSARFSKVTGRLTSPIEHSIRFEHAEGAVVFESCRRKG